MSVNVKIEVSVEEIVKMLRERFGAPTATVTFSFKERWEGDQRDGYNVTKLESATLTGVTLSAVAPPSQYCGDGGR